MRPANCINCAAPLTGNKCSYCGTEYTDDGHLVADFDQEILGELFVDGQIFKVYLSNVEINVLRLGSYRGMDGRLVSSKPILKHKFTLVEV